MNGYSKIKRLSSPRQSPKPMTNPISKAQETKQKSDIKAKNTKTLEPFQAQEHEDGDGDRCNVILNRSYSVSAISRRFKAEKNTSSLQFSMKRAFSVRSSSVADGYSRIHDQNSHTFSPPDDDGLATTRSKKRRGKFLKACKKLFGR